MEKRRHGTARSASNEGRGVALLLAIALVVVVGLFAQAFVTIRSHRAVVRSSLNDFAAFGAQRIATELDRWYSTIILDRIAAARATHYRWAADPDSPIPPPTVERPLPDGTITTYFSLADTGVVVHGVEPGPAERAWIADQVSGHLPGYPPPAPYVVLRSNDANAVVYRKEAAYGQTSVYGFVLRFDVPVERYGRIVDRTALVPRSLVDRASSRELFAVSVHLAPDQPALFPAELAAEVDGPEAWAFAPKAGRLAVRVRVDAARTEAHLSRDAPASLPILLFLFVLTAGLLYSAVALVRRAQHLSRLREAFVTNVSHDLKTPITQIRMFSESLRRGRFADPDDRARAFEAIERQTEVVEDLVDNLLYASGRRAHLTPVPTDMEGLAADVIEGLAPAAEARGSEVLLRANGHHDAVVDPLAATRILTNLVDNAIRHGRQGGRVEVSVSSTDGATLMVDDDGPGIPVSVEQRVFERFEQLGGDAPFAAGTGLGLSVVRELVERHGGHVTVGPSPLGGARIVVRLGDAAHATIGELGRDE